MAGHARELQSAKWCDHGPGGSPGGSEGPGHTGAAAQLGRAKALELAAQYEMLPAVALPDALPPARPV